MALVALYSESIYTETEYRSTTLDSLSTRFLSQIGSVVDPDPVRSETFGIIRIRINHAGSGSEQLRIRDEFEIKLLW